ncbi:hypothetical protein [Brevibacillus laterosporus]|uniref:hypothetical protein n=1 Tax=Brevibacillus laterosporus TaxID=1465 RepID=UPI0015E20A73|nr:hypothetical protein [Brevibacillus laterosporus]
MNGSLTKAHEDNSREYFCCYSPNLYEFLKRWGLRYICSGLHEKTLGQGSMKGIELFYKFGGLLYDPRR